MVTLYVSRAGRTGVYFRTIVQTFFQFRRTCQFPDQPAPLKQVPRENSIKYYLSTFLTPSSELHLSSQRLRRCPRLLGGSDKARSERYATHGYVSTIEIWNVSSAHRYRPEHLAAANCAHGYRTLRSCPYTKRTWRGRTESSFAAF